MMKEDEKDLISKYLIKKLEGRETKESKEEEEKQMIFQTSEISLILNDYDDLFSDFDPRPFSQRALSEDFLSEAKRATREKSSGGIDLKFLIPKEKRNVQTKNMIKKRLNDHIKKHFNQAKGEIDSIKKRAYRMIALGIIIMFGAAIVSYLQSRTLIAHLLLVLLEPAGWFIFWTVLDQIFYEAKKKSPDYEFYEKMTRVDIKFMPY